MPEFPRKTQSDILALASAMHRSHQQDERYRRRLKEAAEVAGLVRAVRLAYRDWEVALSDLEAQTDAIIGGGQEPWGFEERLQDFKASTEHLARAACRHVGLEAVSRQPADTAADVGGYSFQVGEAPHA